MRHFAYVVVLCLSLCGITSCEVETSGNGELDGFWHLERIDTLQNSGSKDLTLHRIFWSFQGKILMLNDMDYQHPECVMTFTHHDQQLLIVNPLMSDRTKGDPLIKDVKVLAPYGIHQLDERFEVETLSNRKMILRSQRYRLVFIKF